MRGLVWRWVYGYLDSVAFAVGATGYLDRFVQARSSVCDAWLVIGGQRRKLRDCARPWRAAKARVPLGELRWWSIGILGSTSVPDRAIGWRSSLR